MRDVAHILAVSIHLSPLGYSLACWSTYLAVAPTGFLVPIQIFRRAPFVKCDCLILTCGIHSARTSNILSYFAVEI